MPTTKMIKQTIFCCTKCDFESQSLHETQQHEKRHEQTTCEHKKRAYDLIDNRIECTCLDCMVSGDVYIESYRLEALFIALGGELKIREASRAKKDREEALCKDFEKKYGRPMNETERNVFLNDKEIDHGSL